MTRRTGIAILFASPIAAKTTEEDAVLMALDNFMSGWNSRDPEKYADALFFPHVILDDGHVSQYASREELVARGKALWASAPKEWDHSVWVKRQIVQRIGDTVHAIGTWARKDKAGKTIHTASVLYVVVKRDGHWKIFT